MKSKYYLDWRFTKTYTDKRYECQVYATPMGKVVICLYKISSSPYAYAADKVVDLIFVEKKYRFDRWCWRPNNEE